MRALVQRVTQAAVNVAGERVGEIGPGLLVLVCAMQGDDEAEAAWLARKAVNLRIFRDAEGRMNRSVAEADGAALIVSQFTLAAETKGNRPGFSRAAAPDEGRRLYDARRYPEAAFQFQKVLSLDPAHEEARRYLDYARGVGSDSSVTGRFQRLE